MWLVVAADSGLQNVRSFWARPWGWGLSVRKYIFTFIDYLHKYVA